MSVFDLPRLHFGGVATTRLPTGPRSGLVDFASHRALTDEGPFPVDRPATEYHAFLDRRGPRFGADGQPDAEGPFSLAKGWDFGGSGHFSMDATLVAAETGPGADAAGAGAEDPVIGACVDVWGHYNPYLRSTVNRARVLDLDPASRWTTALMVGHFGLGRRGRSHDGGYAFTGGVSGLHPPRWVDLAHVADAGAHALAPALRYSAVHQFVLPADELDWLPGAEGSPAVAALRAAVAGGAAGLVVQLALDGMATPREPDSPTRWRVRGTLAPWHAHELRSYPAGRLLVPLPGSPLHHLSAEVAHGLVTLNMITAVRHASRAAEAGPGPLHRLGPPLGAGELELRTGETGRLVARIPESAYLAGARATSGIVTVRAEPDWPAAAGEPLLLTGRGADGARRTLLAEREVNVQSDEALVVLHHRDRARGRDHAVRVPVRAYVRGRPAAVGPITVRQFHNPRALPADAVAGGPAARVGDAELLGLRGGPGAFASTCTMRTDEHGDGVLTLRGERAGTGRLLLTAGPDGPPPVDPEAPGSAWAAYDDGDALGFWAGAGALAVRVLPDDWHLDDIPREEVDFALLHREVFAFYEHISSFMRSDVFSLADRFKVETYAELLAQMCDPANRATTYYMPPTRDLSDPKARLLLAYLRNVQRRPPAAAAPVPPAAPGITTRGELWTALKQAAALELAVMLQYLYAAFSLPTHGAGLARVREGAWTPRQLELACGGGGTTLDDGIRGSLLNVAREEMIHFLLVNNIIMAMGEAFHVPALDFGSLDAVLPVPLDLALDPLGIGSVQRFIAIEEPASLVAAVPRRVAASATAPGGGSRRGFTWGSISELYSGIREGLCRVPDLFLVDSGRGGGEHRLFLRETVNRAHPDYQLEVDDLSSALFAVDLITEQGEGGATLDPEPRPGASAEVSHFHTFLRIGEVLLEERAPGPHGRLVPWSPAYPVLRNPTLHAGRGARAELTDPQAREVAQLFNRGYFLALQLMAQHFGQSPDGSLRRSKLMEASIDVMTGVMRPLAELLVTMDSGRRGRTAGPTFELDTVPVPQPRPDVARRAIALRFAHLARAARALPVVPEQVGDMLAFYADRFRQEGPA